LKKKHAVAHKMSTDNVYAPTDLRHFENGFIHYISAADHPILMQFGAQMHSLIPRIVKWKTFGNSKRQTAAIWKIVIWLQLSDLLSG